MHLDKNYRNRDTDMLVPNSFLYSFLELHTLLRCAGGRASTKSFMWSYMQLKYYKVLL